MIVEGKPVFMLNCVASVFPDGISAPRPTCVRIQRRPPDDRLARRSLSMLLPLQHCEHTESGISLYGSEVKCEKGEYHRADFHAFAGKPFQRCRAEDWIC